MGNFNHLTERVLAQHTCKLKVSSFPSVEKETGNFPLKSRNFIGNFTTPKYQKGEAKQEISMETKQETMWKLGTHMIESLSVEKRGISFLSACTPFHILDRFFDCMSALGMELLSEDKQWLKRLSLDINVTRLKSLLVQYIGFWHCSMSKETIQHKKQNRGRFSANSFFREEVQLITRKA